MFRNQYQNKVKFVLIYTTTNIENLKLLFYLQHHIQSQRLLKCRLHDHSLMGPTV